MDAKREYLKAMEQHAAAALVREAMKKVQKDDRKAAVKKGTGKAGQIAAEMAKADEAEPTRKRYIATDVTVEKLGVILADNPNGILLALDEAITLLRTMEREGHESDRGFYLMAWNGDSRYSYDRIGRGTIDIESATVSIVGSIQPGPLNDYMRSAVHGGTADDGLMQRFQVSVWPDPSPT